MSQTAGIAILGSTGSIGTQTLEVINAHPERFTVVSLAARQNVSLLRQQAARYHPQLVVFGQRSTTDTGWLTGEAGLIAAATHPGVDIVVVATSGHAAILPTIRAIEAGKTIALANKEVLVCAGSVIMPLARRFNVQIRPVDSEHSAIWQALGVTAPGDVSKLLLTASGGPFRTWTADALRHATPEDALAHPTWSMGAKVTIDSATMMNKGLELIEAHWLFNVPFGQIEVLVHPQSIVHSIVEFRDGSQVAQLSTPDMRLPIQYALTWPNHLAGPARKLDLASVGTLEFESPDHRRFPALQLARQAGESGGTLPTVLSAADEVAVEAFLQHRIGFTGICAVVASCLDQHLSQPVTNVEEIFAADAWARQRAKDLINRH